MRNLKLLLFICIACAPLMMGTDIEGGGGCGGISTTSTTTTYSVGGTITGQTSGLALQNNGGDTLAVSASDASFTFSTELADGETYAVTVSTQPTGQTCSVSSGSGTINGANITDVSITCSTDTYSIGGTVSGQSFNFTVQNNGADDLSLSASDTDFTFSTEVADAASYAVTVSAQPSGQACSVSNGTGTVNGANVTDVAVTCVDAIILFESAGTDGDFGAGVGGRAGSDDICATERDILGLTCSTGVSAFISVSSGDTIASMPTNFSIPSSNPVVSTDGTEVAADWSTLASGTLTNSLFDAGVTSGGTSSYWTGSTDSGGLSTSTCSAWTSTSFLAFAAAGDPTSTGNGARNSGLSLSCVSPTIPLICACY